MIDTLQFAGRTVEWVGITERIGHGALGWPGGANFYVKVQIIGSPFPRELGKYQTVRADCIKINRTKRS